MTLNSEELEKLNDLLERGILSEEEFKREKEKLLNSPNDFAADNLFGLNEHTYCFLIHISVLLGFVNVVLGLIAPLILWIINRDKNQNIDQHGKNVLNWIISFTLYIAICFIILFPLNHVMHLSMNFSYDFSSPISLFSGFVPISILMILNIIFIVLGGIKAASGQLWRYPLSISFLKN